MATPQQQRSAKVQPLRVLIYTTCYNVLDGVTLTIRSIEQGILAAGHNVCILTTNSGNPINTDMNGIHPNRSVIFIDNTIPLPFVNDIDKPETSYCVSFSISPHVQQQLKEYAPSIIHITVTDYTTLHLIQYARLKEIPIMGTYHSNMADYLDHYGYMSCIKPIIHVFFRHQYNFLLAIYAPTPFTCQKLIHDIAIDRVTSIQVWGHGVDIDTFNPAHRSIEFRKHIFGSTVPEETPILLWVGRLVREKRFDIFMNVVRRLHTQKCKFHALVVGTGVYEDEIKTLPNTTFAGWLTANELSTVYASCDVFLFPSAVETFGLVTLEAVASGLPVIVEAGCSGHLVHNEKNGYVCPDNDEDAFYEATRILIDDRQKRQEFGTYGRAMSLSLEKSVIVRQMVDNYSRIIDQFYTKYSGHYSKRDIEYTQPGSFLLGNYPRPFTLTSVEAAFRLWFNVMHQLTRIITFYNACIAINGSYKKKSKSSNDQDASSSEDTSVISKIQSLQSDQSQKDRQNAIDAISRERNDVEVDSINYGRQPLLSSGSTKGRSTGMSSAPTNNMQNRQPRDTGIGHTIITTCAHVIVTTIVVSMQIQGRIESHVRHCVASVWSGTTNNSRIESTEAAKRK